jgi:uncharacterized protein YacL
MSAINGYSAKQGTGVLLVVLRCLYILILGGTAARIANEMSRSGQFAQSTWVIIGTFAVIMVIGLVILAVDIAYPRKQISSISAIFFGLTVGSILGYFLRLAIAPTLSLWFREDMLSWFGVILTAIVCYICVSILLQTKNEFRFVIPYVEFQPQLKGTRPLVLDSGVIIDGRIADIADSGILDQAIVIPAIVLDEVQAIADSHDKIRRKRGIRGLEIVDRLRRMNDIDVDIRSDSGETGAVGDVGSRLLRVCQEVNGRLVTNDVTFAKAAKIHNVDTISLNEIANAFKPPVLWGDRLTVAIVKEGEEPGQGVGYLDDGTMVVVDMGKRFVGHEVNLIVDSFLQTTAGRMVFGRIDSKNPSPSHAVS